jgi:hypothetical protein
MPQKLTKHKFIVKAIEIHKNEYDYSQVDYVNNATKVKILCRHHGIFSQTPRDHLVGKGCMLCSFERKSLGQRMSLEDFISKAESIHKNKYDYSLVEFTNNRTKIKIVCPEHGVFEQKLSLHLLGSGCSECGVISRAQTHLLSTKQFIDLSLKKHGDIYDYSTTIYINAKTPVLIKCKNHGLFTQKPNDHLDGHGCGKCAKNVSNMETAWLDLQLVPKENRNITLKIGSQRFYVDGYYNGIIYEFYGDFWHGNPLFYPSNDYCKVTRKTFGEMYNRTIIRKQILQDHGFVVISEWENNFRETYEKLRRSGWRSSSN